MTILCLHIRDKGIWFLFIFLLQNGFFFQLLKNSYNKNVKPNIHTYTHISIKTKSKVENWTTTRPTQQEGPTPEDWLSLAPKQ